jgi:hypothetical protein
MLALSSSQFDPGRTLPSIVVPWVTMYSSTIGLGPRAFSRRLAVSRQRIGDILVRLRPTTSRAAILVEAEASLAADNLTSARAGLYRLS